MRPGFPQPTAPSPAYSTATSTWRSPVPYLFGGLAAMLGLIAFALLILACSYWRISGFLDDDDAAAAGPDRSSASTSAGDAGKPAGRKPAPTYLEEGFVVVVMAGDNKPTFLATPRAPPPPPPPFGSLDSSTGGAVKVTGEAAGEEEGKEGGGGGEGITHQHQHQPEPVRRELDCPSRS